MAIYIVTGKLGGGKTLACISKINDGLASGKRVATNLDLRLHHLPSVSRYAKKCDVTRLPDNPTVEDLKALGKGIPGNDPAYDEEKAGLIVLDECGTWLNSRDWQAEGRRELINYLLHIRKMMWDVYLIIQDISMLDKQARKALAEHVVYCRRTDRMNIPIIGSIFKMITAGSRLPVPKWHIALVKYGDQQHSITVDTWWYNGSDLYNAYDTMQIFSHEYDSGIYRQLPPHYYNSKARVKEWSLKKIMQLTHIYLRKYSLISLVSASAITASVLTYIFVPTADTKEPTKKILQPIVNKEPSNDLIDFSSLNPITTASLRIDKLKIQNMVEENIGTIKQHTVTFKQDLKTYSTYDLNSQNIQVNILDHCRIELKNNTQRRILTCV